MFKEIYVYLVKKAKKNEYFDNLDHEKITDDW